MTKPTFKIIFTRTPYREGEYVKSGLYKRFEFVGRGCIANHNTLHVFTDTRMEGLVPKFRLGTLNDRVVSVEVQTEDEYVLRIEQELNACKPNDEPVNRTTTVGAILDNMVFKFTYLDGYAGEVLANTNYECVLRHYNGVKDDPNVIVSVEYVDSTQNETKYDNHQVLNKLIKAVCIGRPDFHIGSVSSPVLWYGTNNSYMLTSWRVENGSNFITEKSFVNNAISIIEVIRAAHPRADTSEVIKILSEYI